MNQWNAEFMHRAMNQLGPRDDPLYSFKIVVVMAKATDQPDV
jgi:hypothetical protein